MHNIPLIFQSFHLGPPIDSVIVQCTSLLKCKLLKPQKLPK